MCAAWMTFEGFFADMGERPPGTSIGRIDVNGDYCPENCRWEGVAEQQNNKRSTPWLTAFGKTQPLMVWAREYDVRPHVLRDRLKDGWTPEAAIATPVRKWTKGATNEANAIQQA